MSDNNFTAVEILIKRMETNPDEFLRGGRLGYVADAIYEAALSPKLESERLWFFKDAEKIKLIAAYREFCRARFQEELFTRLFEEKVEPIQKSNALTADEMIKHAQTIFDQEYAKQRAAGAGVFTAAGEAVRAIPRPGGLLTTGGLK